MGSASLSCSSLKALADDGTFEISAVVTQPDKSKGRHLIVSECPVKELARTMKFPVLTPSKVNNPEFITDLKKINPDLIVVIAYGQILSREILDIPSKGCVNLHASLLPKYRGAAPIQWAVANGETVTGVTTMFINERMDEGDIILQDEITIEGKDTAESMCEKIASRGANLILKTLKAIDNGTAVRVPQDNSKATYARKLTKEDGRIDWTMPARAIYNRVRGFLPWPGTYCFARSGDEESRLAVLKASVEDGDGKPGEVISVDGEGPLIAAGDGALRLLEVRPAGRKIMSGQDYVRGHSVSVGQFIS